MGKKKYYKIGALWNKRSRNDIDYMSGTIKWKGKIIRISIFANSYKQADQPDWNIIFSDNQNNNGFDNDEVPF